MPGLVVGGGVPDRHKEKEGDTMDIGEWMAGQTFAWGY